MHNSSLNEVGQYLITKTFSNQNCGWLTSVRTYMQPMLVLLHIKVYVVHQIQYVHVTLTIQNTQEAKKSLTKKN